MEILVLVILTLLNAFFALSEIALVSVKRSRMEQLVDKGNGRAKKVLKLLDNPERFLSAVQVGITLIGIVSGAYGGATLTDDLEQALAGVAWLGDYRHVVSMVTVIGSITYFSIVIGELVPKTIAMSKAEKIALATGPVIHVFTLATMPFVRLLAGSTNLIVRLFGIRSADVEKVSEEELVLMLKTAKRQGVLEAEETEVHQNLFYFTNQTAKSLMTHRSEMEWIDISESIDAIGQLLRESHHSKFPVCRDDADTVVGILHLRDYLANHQNPGFKLEDILSKPIYIAESTPAFKILALFKSHHQHVAVVVDEFGGTKGIVTLHDLTEAIVGDLPTEEDDLEPYIQTRDDHSWFLDGRTPIFELNQHFETEIVEESIGDYTTISGFLLSQFQGIPKTGDKLDQPRWSFEIVDMDGIRIDKIVMVRKPVEKE